VCGLQGANSTEFKKHLKYPVIDLMEEQKKIKGLGGTMRLGVFPCDVAEGTRSREVYGQGRIEERHRHRYEFNNEYRDVMEKAGMVFAGVSPEGDLVEIIELRNHPWFVACQFHPEFQSTPMEAHPLFRGFVEAAAGKGLRPLSDDCTTNDAGKLPDEELAEEE
jgi:CTP synthase